MQRMVWTEGLSEDGRKEAFNLAEKTGISGLLRDNLRGRRQHCHFQGFRELVRNQRQMGDFADWGGWDLGIGSMENEGRVHFDMDFVGIRQGLSCHAGG